MCGLCRHHHHIVIGWSVNFFFYRLRNNVRYAGSREPQIEKLSFQLNQNRMIHSTWKIFLLHLRTGIHVYYERKFAGFRNVWRLIMLDYFNIVVIFFYVHRGLLWNANLQTLMFVLSYCNANIIFRFYIMTMINILKAVEILRCAHFSMTDIG